MKRYDLDSTETSCIEHHSMDFFYNVFVILSFASMAEETKGVTDQDAGKRRKA